MNKKDKKQVMRALFLIAIIIFTLIKFELIFFRSFLSVYSVCNTQTFEDNFNNTYTVGGSTSLETIGNESHIRLQLRLDDSGEIDGGILKHEIVHINQIIRGWPSLSCDHPIQKYLSEVEAYTMQWLPDFLFKRIYGI